MKRFVLMLVAALFSWLAAPQPSEAVLITAATVVARAYDAQPHGVVASHAPTERGPPTHSAEDRSAIAVDLEARCAASRSGAASLSASPAYAGHILFARDARRTGPIQELRIGDDVAMVSLAGLCGVAAKAGMSVAEAESWAAARAAQLQAQLPAGSAGRVTMGAGVVRDGSGNLIRVVSTSEPNGYLRAGVTLEPGEVLVRGAGHAEADIVKWAADNGYEVVTIGAGRPICPACAGSISGSGGSAATPLKVP